MEIRGSTDNYIKDIVLLSDYMESDENSVVDFLKNAGIPTEGMSSSDIYIDDVSDSGEIDGIIKDYFLYKEKQLKVALAY